MKNLVLAFFLLLFAPSAYGQITNVTETTATVAWPETCNSTSGEQWYEVELNGTPLSPLIPIGTNTRALTGLTPDTTYTTRVRCVNLPEPGALLRYTTWGVLRTFSTLAPIDETAPVLTQLGADPVTVVQGNAYTSPGWDCSDAVDGAIVPTVNTSAVNVSVIGSYTETADCQDAAGNNAIQGTRTVDVVATDPQTWASRSTGPGVIFATNFPDAASVSDNVLPDGQAGQVTRDTTTFKSGGGSLRFEMLDTNGTNFGNWYTCWSDPCDPMDPNETVYIQFRQYTTEYMVNHDWEHTGGSRTGWKQIIVSAADEVSPSSNEPWEVVLTSDSIGWPIGYWQDGQVSARLFQDDANTRCSATDFRQQNVVDRGLDPLTGVSPDSDPWTDCEQDRARYGGLYSVYNAPYNIPRLPADPISGAWKYPLNGWATYMIRITLGPSGLGSAGNLLEVYAAQEGEDFELIMQETDATLGAAGAGEGMEAIWLLPYVSRGIPEPTRQDTFTLYDEVIVSSNYIPAPAATGLNTSSKVYTYTPTEGGGFVGSNTINPNEDYVGTIGPFGLWNQLSTGNIEFFVDTPGIANTDESLYSITVEGVFAAGGGVNSFTLLRTDADFFDGAAVGNTASVWQWNAQPDLLVGGNTYTITINWVPPTSDTTAPVITLVGADPLVLTDGDTFTDPGATCLDNVDGQIDGSVVEGGTPPEGVVSTGNYTRTYDCQDAAGNDATQVARTVTVNAGASVSVLEQAIIDCPVKEWCRLPASTEATLDAAFDAASGDPGATLYFANKFIYVEEQNLIVGMANKGNCCGATDYSLTKYDLATDTATQSDWASGTTNGHAYDGNAEYDPVTNLMWVNRYFSRFPWSLDPATMTIGTRFTAQGPPADAGHALSFHRDRRELVFIGTGEARTWDVDTQPGSWSGTTGENWGNYHNFGVYNPDLQIVWAGAGNSATTSTAYLPASGSTWTAVNSAYIPFDLNINNAHIVYDPASGAYLIHDKNTTDWRVFNPVTATGTPSVISGMVNTPTSGANESAVIAMEGLGAIIMLRHTASATFGYIFKSQ